MSFNVDGLAVALTKELVTENAPEELPFFEDLVHAANNPKKGKSESYMGFGGSDAVMVVLTGAFLDVSKCIAAFVWANGRDATGELIKNCSESAREVLSQKFATWMETFKGKPPLTLPSHGVKELEREIDGLKSSRSLAAPHIRSVRDIIARFEGSD